ncbi:MAG: hypothetical protein JWN69_2215, partial [Alphaproteobacteria bacterium]|nr:hypothetical protein [Alphaproteobacteria bacterium]
MTGWWPAIVYAVVGLVCWSVGGARREGLERVAWALLSVSLLLSGLLRSYAVQSRITDSWREAAR